VTKLAKKKNGFLIGFLIAFCLSFVGAIIVGLVWPRKVGTSNGYWKGVILAGVINAVLIIGWFVFWSSWLWGFYSYYP
jgi:hypothetical protein